MSGRRILYAVLNWGAGHATRSVPVIESLLRRGHEVVLASDGMAGEILRKRFPALPYEELPSYKVRYPRKGRYLLPALAGQSFQALRVFGATRELISRWVKKYAPDQIISDGRPAVRHKNVHSVYVTHQLKVLAGPLTRAATALHKALYEQFHEIWVPDYESFPYYSGMLGHPERRPRNLRYMGILSRFLSKKNFADEESVPSADWLIILSGPETQRTVLEQTVKNHASLFSGKVVLVRGTLHPPAAVFPSDWTVYDWADETLLYNLILKAKKLILRSGYSSVMDLVAMQKQAILIPTPGQPEQEYLARFLHGKGLFPAVSQSALHHIPFIDWNRFRLPRRQSSERFDKMLFP